ncbi:amino acid/peptide transporter [Sphingomonas sp. LH128]|uniref:Amino acid/peptide transporter n=1 Tax=Novosphingobium resinovorum TaxID=158500 RepID=A0A031K3X5_9SPHN|nr:MULTISPECIES: oligopeptide:H+ symporter [Sphingomonadaceae]EJU13009.1 amino acid/peptide transporter [Sphingomonas sp. LH128]EZP84671.1 Amino acid/peptide transporter [Novosphingobium resinovorum]
MTAPEATPNLDFPEEAARDDRAFLGHPKGLGLLGLVEGCERFSYYSMQTLLTLYMVKYLLVPGRQEGVIGLDWVTTHVFPGLSGQPLASEIFGLYTALVYLTPILGGILADLLLGRRAALIAGGVVMSLGHFLMAFESAFLLALISLVVGVGLFKGNIASQVGELYKQGDIRRAMAFQIFYIFINVSVIVAPLISGTLGEKVGWHWGFGCAGVVMVLGLLLYIYAKPWLPADSKAAKSSEPRATFEKGDGPRLLAVLVLVPIMGISLLTNQQIFNAYLVWADQQFQLSFMGETLPSSWMITIDATLSFSMLVAVAAFWAFVGKRTGKEPDELGKMILGCAFIVGGAACLYMAAATQGTGKIGLFWPVMFHLVNSIGFAHLLPVSLALFTRLAPRALNASIVGIYYLSFFGANLAVGKIGTLFSTMPTTQFWLLHMASAAVATIGFVVFKLFFAKRLMGTA